jgi:hypothetical protein
MFSTAEAARLPDNLVSLPRVANVPEIEAVVLSLLQHDSEFVEIAPPTDLHADALLGRFTPRIFLTTESSFRKEEIRRFMEDPAVTQEQLLNLPQRFDDVQAVLVLYFNVFLESGEILPTKEVAFWLDYSFSGKVSFDLPFNEAVDRIRFRAIEYQRRTDSNLAGEVAPGQEYRYRLLDQNSMARQNFLDVKPQVPGMDVTSVRGSCLGCHRNQIATFDTHGRREFKSVRPFVREGRQMLTPFYQKFENQLHEMEQQYLERNSNPAHSRR